MINLPVRFSQLDEPWCSHLLGNNTDPKFTIYNYGCLLCCFAMALKYYGYDTDPLRLNEAFISIDAFEPNSGIYRWGKLNALDASFSDTITKTPNLLTDEQVNEIKNALDRGYPVALELDYNPKTVALDMHFVLAIGYNPNEENDITIADPLGGKIHSLKDYLGWFKPNARDTIEAYVIISGTPPNNEDANTIPVSKLVFPQLVHGSGEWDKVIGKYMPDADPKAADFENLDKVIGGIKSRGTDAFKQLEEQAASFAEAQQSVTNLKEQLQNEELQRQKDKEMYAAQINALKSSGQNIERISQIYEGRVSDLQGQIKNLLQDKHIISISNARLAVNKSVNIAQKYFPTFLSWIALLKRK